MGIQVTTGGKYFIFLLMGMFNIGTYAVLCYPGMVIVFYFVYGGAVVLFENWQFRKLTRWRTGIDVQSLLKAKSVISYNIVLFHTAVWSAECVHKLYDNRSESTQCIVTVTYV